MNGKILVVDDDPVFLEEICTLLGDEQMNVLQAANGGDALAKFDSNYDISVVITDLSLPDYDGMILIEMLRNISLAEKRVVQFVVMSGDSDQQDTINALKKGVSDYLVKPVDPARLLASTRNALGRVSKDQHEVTINDQNRNKALNLEKELDHQNEELVSKLSIAAELKDPETGNHINRIGSYAELMSRLIGLSVEMQEIMFLAAPLHDIGKIGTPEAILQKTGGLTEEEMIIMQQHTHHGHRILSKSRSKTFQVAAEIALAHHERWDGSGYPQALQGEQIPLVARITTLVDVYDALRSKRAYKLAFSHAQAMTILLEGDGRTIPQHFDPQLLEIFDKHQHEFKEIYELLKD